MDLIDPTHLWRSYDHGECCDCCVGYCIREDQPDEWMDIYRLSDHDDITYLGSPWLMLRADLVAPLPDNVTVIETKVKIDWKPPTNLAPLSKERNGAFLLTQITEAGLIVREHDDEVRRPVYLKANDAFAGWTTINREPARDHCASVDDIPIIQAIAHRGGISINAAAAAYNVTRGSV